jgi:hypothetical protein
MQCEKAYVGHQLPCPNCAVELRIPFSDGAGGSPDSLPRAQLVVVPGSEMAATALGDSKKVREAKATATDIPEEIIVKREPKTPQPSAKESQKVELNPAMKPRLAYILSGGEKVEPNSENQKNDGRPEKSFNE